MSYFVAPVPSSPERISNTNDNIQNLNEYQAKQWENHKKNITAQQQAQYSLNQTTHSSILKGGPRFNNPFQKLPGILSPIESQVKNTSNNTPRKKLSKLQYGSSKSLHSSQSLSLSQKSLLEAEAIYRGNTSPKIEGANLPSPTKSSFLSFLKGTDNNKILSLKGKFKKY